MDEKKLQKIRQIIKLADKDFATTKEVAEIIGPLIEIIKQAKPEAIEAAVQAAEKAITELAPSAISILANSELRKIRVETKQDRDDMIQEFSLILSDLQLKKGPPGPRGKRGREPFINYDFIVEAVHELIDIPEEGHTPKHEWDGTKLRFEKPDGTWGKWVDLQGKPGKPGQGQGFTMFGGSLGGEQVEIRAGANVTVTRSPGGAYIISATGGGGGTMVIEAPTGTVNDSNLDFVFTAKPFLVVVNGASYRENHGWTWTSGTSTVTLTYAVGTGGDIYGIMQ